MSRVLEYAFAFDCADSAGDVFRLDVVARSDGELEVAGDYDLDIDLTWAELSGRESRCARFLAWWDEDPVVFLLRLAPVSDAVKIQIAAGFARHVWTYTDVPIPESVAAVVEFAEKIPAGAAPLGQMVFRTDLMSVRGYDEVKDAGNVAQLGYRAAQSLGEAWRRETLGMIGADERLVEVAQQAERAAAFARSDEYDPEQAQAERAWQLRYMLECLNAEQRGEPWPLR